MILQKIIKKKKIAHRKKTKKKEKIIDGKANDELIEETNDIDKDNKNKKKQKENKLKEENDNTKEITNKENIISNNIENESIEGDLLNYYIEEIKKTIEEDKNDKFIKSTEIEEKNMEELKNKKKIRERS